MKRKVQAYFTVEAAMIIPVVISVILFIIGLWFFQYDRCLLEQDMGALALKGSAMNAEDKTEAAEQVKDWQSRISRDKFVLWNQKDMEIKLEKDTIAVRGSGELEFPFAGMDFWGNAVWRAQARYENHRIDPALFVRNYRRIVEGE